MLDRGDGESSSPGFPASRRQWFAGMALAVSAMTRPARADPQASPERIPLGTLSAADRDAWIRYLQSHQGEDGLFHDPVVFDQFDFCSFWRHEKSSVASVGGAHAPSPDVRCGHPALRSLDAGCAPGILPSLAANAGSQGMGTPSQDHPDSARKHARDVLSSSSSRRHRDCVFE